jgi:siroheme synthase
MRIRVRRVKKKSLLDVSEVKMSSNSSVHVFGFGVRAIAQITLESNYLLPQMEKVFHSEHDPRISEYLGNIGCTEVSLKHLYEDGRQRQEVYQEICDTIVEAARAGVKCGYLAPGNPVFLNTIVFSLREATSRFKIPFFAYSGVSSIDTLLTDLFIPVELTGLQCFEATHFVRMRPTIDKRVPLVLFQPAVVEAYEIRRLAGVYLPGVRILQDLLIDLYGPGQQWILLRSATTTDENPVLSSGTVSDLVENANDLKLGTLLIPGNWECPALAR